jgi:hypothetical protein
MHYMPRPWDKLEDETRSAYTHFLIYRNLGPARTLQLAYDAYLEMNRLAEAKAGKKKKAEIGDKPVTGGQWRREYPLHEWKQRAEFWDVWVFTEAGDRVVVLMLALVDRLLEQALEGTVANRPNNWSQVLETVKALRELVPQESFLALCRHSAAMRAGGGNDGDAGRALRPPSQPVPE